MAQDDIQVPARWFLKQYNFVVIITSDLTEGPISSAPPIILIFPATTVAWAPNNGRGKEARKIQFDSRYVGG